MIPHRPKVSRWDVAAIGMLGAFGFSLSYDALQQMAQAIHVRGELTYAWPVVVDGFIAYGVRALVLLREAPWTARAYAWTLFSGATGTSIWANALHAVRLNEQTVGLASELRLGNTAVGALSTIAPIALAGAVHLGIIVTRHGAAQRDADTSTSQPSLATPQSTALDRSGDPAQPLALDTPTNAAKVVPALSETHSGRAELKAGTEKARPRTAGEKLAAHRQGTRLRDRIAIRILRRTQHNLDGPGSRSGAPSGGPDPRSGGPASAGGPGPWPGGPSEAGGPSGGPVGGSGPGGGSGPVDAGGPGRRAGGPSEAGGPVGGNGPSEAGGPASAGAPDPRPGGPSGGSGPADARGPGPWPGGPSEAGGPASAGARDPWPGGPSGESGPGGGRGPVDAGVPGRRSGGPSEAGGPASAGAPDPRPGGPSGGSGPADAGGPGPRPGGPSGGPVDGRGPGPRSGGPSEAGGPSGGPVDGRGPDPRSGGPSGGSGPADAGGRKPEPLDPALLTAGRRAAAEAGRITRKVVGDGIRAQGLTVSNDRIPEILQALRTDRPPPQHR
ncbi:DUF2637 domain-containing protein [Kitasatospora sp. NPDC048538]|uniref:DUF2637 domain-containing protein n=1 Tax=Kitasatospora sp. NPDC048538 TaxID=3155633 RepID=UPI0033C70E29